MKEKLRKDIAQRQKNLSKEWIEAESKKIQKLVIESEEYQKAESIFTYINFGKEVVTIPIIEDALRSGKRVGVPLCLGKGIMEVHEIISLENMTPGAYGILEPAKDTPLMKKEEIDFGIIPCVSCNKKGDRLGHGAGYYDRYLEGSSWVKAILCFDELMEDEIPMEEYDQKMDLVISQSGLIRL